MAKKHSIAQAVSILFFISIGTKLAGFLRDRAIGVIYGLSGTTDSFLVAQTIPTLLAGALAGALGTAFLPVFAEFMAQGREDEAWELSSGILTNVLLVTFLLSGIGMIASKPIILFFASGLSSEGLKLAVTSSQIIFPSLIFAAVNAYLGGLLNAFKVFTAPAIAPFVMNIVVTVSIYVLVGRSGPLALAMATLIGTAVQLLVQVPNLRRIHFRLKLSLGWNTPGVRRVAQLTWPILLGAVLTQVYTLVDRYLASYLSTGSISTLTYGIKVMQLPLGLFVAAISTVLFPTFAELHSRNRTSELAQKVTTGMRTMGLFILPAFIALGLLRIPVIQILFQKGAFSEADTQATAVALLCYLGAGIGQSYTTVINTAMFAMQKTLISVIINAVGTLVNIMFDLLLVKSLGYAGLALANSVASLVITSISFFIIKRYIPGLSLKDTIGTIIKILMASLIMALAIYLGIGHFTSESWLLTNLGRLKMFLLGMAIGVPIYVVALLPLGIPEVRSGFEKLRQLVGH